METPDLDTIARCQQGDEDAFREIYEIYRDRLHRLAFRFTGNAHDASDLTQAIFVRINTHIANYRAEASFTTWVYRVAKSVCLNYRERKRDGFELLDQPDQVHVQTASDGDPDAAVEARADRRTAAAFLADLPEQQRMVFILKVIEEWSYAEIAQTLDLSVSAVRMLMYRARKSLSERLDPNRGVTP